MKEAFSLSIGAGRAVLPGQAHRAHYRIAGRQKTEQRNSFSLLPQIKHGAVRICAYRKTNVRARSTLVSDAVRYHSDLRHRAELDFR